METSFKAKLQQKSVVCEMKVSLSWLWTAQPLNAQFLSAAQVVADKCVAEEAPICCKSALHTS